MILLCCFMVEHNLPFTLAEPFKRMFPVWGIVQYIDIKRTKFNEIIKSFGKAVSEDLAKKLRVDKCSDIIHEMTIK